MSPARPATPPYYAILLHRPAPAADPELHVETVERLIGLAAVEPGFLGIEDAEDDLGESFTVCYWLDVRSLRRWQDDAPKRVPETLPLCSVIGATGCLWPWLNDVREAELRRPPRHAVPMYDTPAVAPDIPGKPLRRAS